MRVLEQILNLLEDKKAVFLTGGGGVGKSYLTRQIIADFTSSKQSVVALGSTGISAVNIGGVTVPSFFKFGISNDINELAALDKKQGARLKELYEIIKKTDLLIIDEISMISSELFEMIAYRLRVGHFSGALLLVGDFYQLAPVQKGVNALNGNQNSNFTSNNALFAPTNIYAFSSYAWSSINPQNVLLTHSKRTDDLHFYSLLNELRQGILSKECYEFLCSRLINEHNKAPKDALMLFGVNRKADTINKERLNMLNAPLYSIEAKIEVLDKSLSEQALLKWIANLSLPEVLELKVGAEVMFCANKRGSFYIGERGVVIDISDELISVAKKDGSIVDVAQVSFELNEYISDGDDVLSVQRASFSQFPLRLAYAITIHKSQGMSIDEFICDIDDIFARGQLYVALSRATSAQGLFLHFSGANLLSHLRRSVACDDAVRAFYENNNFIKES